MPLISSEMWIMLVTGTALVLTSVVIHIFQLLLAYRNSRDAMRREQDAMDAEISRATQRVAETAEVLREVTEHRQRTKASLRETEARQQTALRRQEELLDQATRLQAASVRTGAFQPPNAMRLPSPNKVAFTSEAIFAQQICIETHDTGLEAVLRALMVGLCQQDYGYWGSVKLGDMRFVINFGSPLMDGSRRYVVRINEPEQFQISLHQRPGRETVMAEWAFQVTGPDSMGVLATSAWSEPLSMPGPPVTMIEPGDEPWETPRERRAILLD